MISKIRHFIPLAIVISGLCSLVYLAVQQDMRMGANDPQIQISEDAAAKLNQSFDLNKIVPSDQVEISQSLSPFVAVFDDSGKLVRSNAKLNGKDIALPAGIFDYTKTHTQDRITWQPQTGVRSALVVTRFTNSKMSGFVASGRSLREVEKREDMLKLQVEAAWVITILASFAGIIIFNEK